MPDRFDTYTAAVAGETAGELVWRVDLVDPDGRTLATTDAAETGGEAVLWQVESDPARIEADRVAQRTSAAVVSCSEANLVPRANGTGMLHPDVGSRVRVWSGIRTGAGDAWWPQSTLAIESVDVVDASGLLSVRLSLTDSIDPVRSDLVTAFRFDAGETVEAVVGRLLAQVLDEDSYRLPVTGRTVLNGDAEIGTDRFELVNSLLEGIGFELVADPLGQILAREILPAGDDPAARRWVYGGPGIAVQGLAKRWTSRQPRAWKITGGSALDGKPAPSITLFDLDEKSQGYFRGLGHPVQVNTKDYPHQEDLDALKDAGYGQFRRHGDGPGVVQFTTVANPAMRQGDIVDLTRDLLRLDSAPHRVLGLELPVHNERLMTVTARAAWSPESGFTSPGVPVDLTGLPSFLDDFGRPDEDLQILPGADDGSPLWTEIDYSWGVVDGLAVQRFPGGWSLAFVNQPMTYADHFAELMIQRLPSGRRVGPVVRCNGTKAGYAALVAADGSVSLEMWLAGRAEAVLGTASVSGSPVGKTIRVQAAGSTISVKVDGVTVLQRSDDRLTGLHVGMLAFGGSGSSAPAVSPFAAAQIA